MESKKQLKEERDKIVLGLEKAYEKLIAHKRKINRPLVVLKNGKIVEVDPNEIAPTTRYRRKPILLE